MSELAENAPVQELVRKNKRRRRILIFCVVSLVNVGLLALLLTQLLTPAQHAVPDPLVGHPAPDFSLAMLRPGSGKSSLPLSNFKGKPVVLNFWASWCAPCKEEMPLLESTWIAADHFHQPAWDGCEQSAARAYPPGIIEQPATDYVGLLSRRPAPGLKDQAPDAALLFQLPGEPSFALFTTLQDDHFPQVEE